MDFIGDIPSIPHVEGKWLILAAGAVFFMFMLARRKKRMNDLKRKDREPRFRNITVKGDESHGAEGRITVRPWMETDGIKRVLAAITADGKVARFVGGCVRDALLERPVKEVDIATPETPDRVMELLEAAGIKALPTGIEHGTVTAVIGGETYQITTLRRDVSTDGRRATVTFTEDWRVDAERRDFTFNTLSATPDGMIYDYFNGLQDLNDRVIKFVGHAGERIEEDRLRVLRFFRFIGTLGMRTDRKGDLESCIQAAPQLTELSRERIRDEIMKILSSEMHFDVIRMMRNHGILKPILPEIGEPTALARLKWLETTATGLESVRPDPIRRLACVLDTDDEGVESVCQNLVLTNKEKRRLKALHHPGWRADPEISEADFERVLQRLGPEITLDIILIDWAHSLVEAPRQPGGHADKWQALIARTESWEAKVYPLNGHDVMALGIEEGPEVSKHLDAVEAWWEEGGFTADRAACLARLKQEVEA